MPVWRGGRGRCEVKLIAALVVAATCASTSSAFHIGGAGLLPANGWRRHLVNTRETSRAKTGAGEGIGCARNRKTATSLALASLRGQGAPVTETVTELLEIVRPGLEGQYSAKQRERIDVLLEVLDTAGKGQSFLQDQDINDFYRVQFTRDVNRGKPVGGGLRYSTLG
jgi:hypothetical protein